MKLLAKAHIKSHIRTQQKRKLLKAADDITKSYRLEGKPHFQGIPISIEQRAGSIRSGTESDGQPWETQMKVAYGRIPRVEGADGEALDVFLNYNNPGCDKVFIVHIRDKDTGDYDEDKVFLGYTSLDQVRECFKAHYEPWEPYWGPVDQMTVDEFKEKHHVGSNGFSPMKKAVWLTLISKAHVKSHSRVSSTGKISVVQDFERIQKPSSVYESQTVHHRKTGTVPIDLEIHGEEYGLFGSKPTFSELIDTYKKKENRVQAERITMPQAQQLSLFGKCITYLKLISRRVLK